MICVYSSNTFPARLIRVVYLFTKKKNSNKQIYITFKKKKIMLNNIVQRRNVLHKFKFFEIQ